MRLLSLLAISALGSVTSGMAFANECPQAYERLIPYSEPVAADETQVNVHNMVTLRYDCKTFMAQTSGGIEATFNGMQTELINASVATDNGRASTRLSTSVTMLGFEVEHEDSEITTVYSKRLKPEHDLDLSREATVQVGPLLVPVRYGLEGSAALQLDVAMRNMGSEAVVMPLAKARAYVQAAVDVQLIKGSANAELILADAALNNILGVHFNPNEGKPSIDVNVVGQADLKAMLGAVTARIEVTEGQQKHVYDQELLRWPGYVNSAKMYEHREKIADMPI